MANDAAWNAGIQIGTNLAEHQRARKEMLSDEERQHKFADYYNEREALRNQLSLVKGDPQQTAAIHNLLTNVQQSMEQLYHPVHAPGAMQKDWDYLKHFILHKKPPTAGQTATLTETQSPSTTVKVGGQPITLPATAPFRTTAGTTPGTPEANITLPEIPVTIPGGKTPTPVAETMAIPSLHVKGLVAPGNIPIWNRPKVQNDDGSHSSEYSTSFTDDRPESKYYGKEVLVPTMVDGKFLTPDGKKPAEGSPEEQKMKQAAFDRYKATGEQLGVFDNSQNADRYAGLLHSRGERPRPPVQAYVPKPAPYEAKLQAQKDQAHKEAEQFAASAAPDPVEAGMKMFDHYLPNASAQQREEHMLALLEAASGMKMTGASTKWVYKSGKLNGQPVMVRYNERDPYGGVQFANGEPMPPELASQLMIDQGGSRSAQGMKFDKVTGQVLDPATGQRYNEADPKNPPEVQAMFAGFHKMDAAAKAFSEELARTRGEGYNESRIIEFLDRNNGNRPVSLMYSEYKKDPDRYVPASGAQKLAAQEVLFNDLAGTSQLVRTAVENLKTDFPPEMKLKIAAAMKLGNPEDIKTSIVDLYASSVALGLLTPDQQDFLVATRQLAENAMAMRNVLGAGAGSDMVRGAIMSTLPSLLSPDRSYALKQLDAYDKTLERLHPGVFNVPLNTQPWKVQPGAPQAPARAPGPAPGKPGVAGPNGAYSLSEAKKLHPGWSDQQVIDDLWKNGFGYTTP